MYVYAGWFLWANSALGNANDLTSLCSQPVNLGRLCFNFWFDMTVDNL